jgi:fermentation-respiration switch protein FrsA (DUF1100 family)
MIFVVDNFRWRIWIPFRRTSPPVILTPDTGEKISIFSSEGRLDGWFAAPNRGPEAAILLFHGLGDLIPYWRRAQHRLAQAGISSLIFAYSGYPGSDRTTTTANLAEDSHAAYAWLREHIPAETPVFLVGFSLGSGLAAEMAPKFTPTPAGLILCESFTSLREAARRIARSLPLVDKLLPDVWRTRDSVSLIPFPILVVHSTGDALFPVSMAEEIYARGRAAGRDIQLSVLQGHAHNAPYLSVPEDYWGAILEFIACVRARRSNTTSPSG